MSRGTIIFRQVLQQTVSRRQSVLQSSRIPQFHPHQFPAFKLGPIRLLSVQKPFNFDKEAEETLESLGDKFEDLLDSNPSMVGSDVSLSNGVLTVETPEHGTYVINKQGPNQQIWLSSPLSGPARFDYIDGQWIYKHTNESLHQLLNREIGETILQIDNANFHECHNGSS
ncbi:hypothetical protein TCAL_16567 [Tigriopus californicus]|uniref:ferroxidase n=1 Tax=Tigriopus californicus TaxID=6832 RepID=A0A553NE40_TIGCA|nr:frataxin homolog, mitochondrial-like [Tigriopus californicus]TRY63675.1 hypothetical protein TCAL_16567 [Tigriopus californicus]